MLRLKNLQKNVNFILDKNPEEEIEAVAEGA